MAEKQLGTAPSGPTDTTTKSYVDAAVAQPITETKSSAYAAAPGEIVPCDATNGGFTISLPSAPPSGTQITVKKIDSSDNAILVQRTGNDTFNKINGASLLQLAVPSQSVVLRYHSGVWHVISNSAPPAALDDRYTPLDVQEILDPYGATAIKLTPTGGSNYLQIDHNSSPPLFAGDSPVRQIDSSIVLADDGPKLRSANSTGTDNLNLYLSGQADGLVYVTQSGVTAEAATTTSPQNLRAKRLTPRQAWAASAATVTPNIHTTDVYNFSALSQSITVDAPPAYVTGGVGPNWLPDPSFDGVFRARPHNSLSTELARTGSRSIKMVTNSTDFFITCLIENGIEYKYVPCSGGDMFYFSIYVRGAGNNQGTTGSISLVLQAHRGTPESTTVSRYSVQGLTLSPSLSTGWTKLEGYYKVPEDTFQVMPEIQISPATTGQIYYADDAVFRFAGNPKQGEELTFCFKDNGTARAITWNEIYQSAGATLPTTTTVGQWTYVRCVYNTVDNKWDAVDVRISNQSFEATSNKGVAGGYPSLDPAGTIPVSQIPTLFEFSKNTNSPTWNFFGPNIATNPGFEDTSLFINKNSSGDFSTEQKRTGLRSWKSIGNGWRTLFSNKTESTPLPCTDTDYFYIEIWVYGHADNPFPNASMAMHLQSWNSAGTLLETTYFANLTTAQMNAAKGVWTRMSGFITPAVGATTFQITMVPNATNCTFYWDDFKVSRRILRNLLETTDAAAARAAIGANTFIDPRDYGAVGNGVVDDTAALRAAIEAASAINGSVLQLAAGDYYCPTLRAVAVSGDITIRGVPGKTRLVGNGTRSANLYGGAVNTAAADVMLQVQPQASLQVENVQVKSHGVFIGLENLIEAGQIKLDKCQFTDSGGVLLITNSSASFTAGVSANKLYTLKQLQVTNCKITNCELGVVFATQGGWQSAQVSDCIFTNVGFVSVWIGLESTLPDTYLQYQRGSFVHHNVFRNLRASAYAQPSSEQGVNAVVVMGESAFIHNNHIENITNAVKWDDTEGIYTKARYFDIHDNVLINAGGSEAAIIAKGSAWQARTALSANMNGLTLPQSTINVTSTAGFPDGNDMFAEICRALVQTSSGLQVVSFTGKTATSLTGCSGGSGTMSTGGTVQGSVQIGNYLEGPASPGTIRNNTVVFTRTDVLQSGIYSASPNTIIENNLVVGATRSAISTIVYGHGCLIAGNRVLNHLGTSVFSSAARNTVFRENTVINHTGSYVPTETSIHTFFIGNDSAELPDRDASGIQIINNYVQNASSDRIRFVQVNGLAGGTKKASDLVIAGNTGFNITRGIHVTSAITATNLVDVENYWRNAADPQPDNGFFGTITFAAQRPGFTVPISSITASTTLPLGVGSLNLGHATDTSIVRTAPGIVTIAGREVVRRTLQTITSATTISTTSGDQLVIINTGGLPTLGTAVGATCEIKLRNNTNAGVLIATTSSQTIDGLSSFTLPANHAVTLVPNNGNWSVF